MDFFKRNKKPTETESLMAMIDEPTESEINHNTVLDYTVALEDDEFKKLIKVAEVYRMANKKADDILGVKPVDGEAIEVRIVTKAANDDFIETETTKGKTQNAKTTK